MKIKFVGKLKIKGACYQKNSLKNSAVFFYLYYKDRQLLYQEKKFYFVLNGRAPRLNMSFPPRKAKEPFSPIFEN